MISWSYSNFTSAVTCLQKYHYSIAKVPFDQESGDMAFGTCLHLSLNTLLTTEDSGEELFGIYWTTYKDKDLKYSRYKWQELENLGYQFLAKFKKMHAPKYKLEFAEERLYADYLGIKLEGTLDFFGDYNGKKSLRDFKTSGYNYDKEKKSVALQLYLYAYLLIANQKGRPETLGYTVFNKGQGSIQDLTWDFKEEEMYAALREMVAYVTLISPQGFTPEKIKNYASCIVGSNKCSYWSRCHGAE